jgi:hypothetical protein
VDCQVSVLESRKARALPECGGAGGEGEDHGSAPARQLTVTATGQATAVPERQRLPWNGLEERFVAEQRGARGKGRNDGPVRIFRLRSRS